MSKSVKITAFAKVNLSLNIEGRADGLHKLDSVMMSVDCFDTVTVTERADEKITVAFDDPTIDPVRNTAYKAAAAVCGKLHRGADISVQKGIPVGAGLGGSSADGAAVLRALDLFYRLPVRQKSHGQAVKFRRQLLFFKESFVGYALCLPPEGDSIHSTQTVIHIYISADLPFLVSVTGNASSPFALFGHHAHHGTVIF